MLDKFLSVWYNIDVKFQTLEVFGSFACVFKFDFNDKQFFYSIYEILSLFTNSNVP